MVAYPLLNVNEKQISNNHEKAQTFNEFSLSYSNINNPHAGLPEDEHFANNLDLIPATEMKWLIYFKHRHYKTNWT